jgi:trigger factor
MQVRDLKRDKNEVTFELEEDYSEVRVYVDKKYKEASRKVKIPGFRAGKIPKQVFINHYGKERLLYDGMMDFLNAVYPKVVEDNKIDAIDYPKDIKIIQLEEEKPIKVAIVVEVKPAASLGKYKGLKVEKDPVDVKKEEIEEKITALLDANAEFNSDESATVTEGDKAIINNVAKVGEEELLHWKREEVEIVVGHSHILKEFDNQIIGLKVGDEKSFDLMPGEDDHVSDELKDKTIHFEVKILNTLVKTLPELSDEFVGEKTEFMSEKEYRDSLNETLRADKELASGDKVKEALVSEVVKGMKVDIPQVMIEKELDYILKRMEYGLTQYNMQMDDYLKIINKSREDIRSEHNEEAINNVKTTLALETIGNLEKIEVSDEELNEEIDDMLSKEKDEARKESLKDYYLKMSDSISDSLKTKKVVEFLVLSAKIKQKK